MLLGQLRSEDIPLQIRDRIPNAATALLAPLDRRTVFSGHENGCELLLGERALQELRHLSRGTIKSWRLLERFLEGVDQLIDLLGFDRGEASGALIQPLDLVRRQMLENPFGARGAEGDQQDRRSSAAALRQFRAIIMIGGDHRHDRSSGSLVFRLKSLARFGDLRQRDAETLVLVIEHDDLAAGYDPVIDDDIHRIANLGIELDDGATAQIENIRDSHRRGAEDDVHRHRHIHHEVEIESVGARGCCLNTDLGVLIGGIIKFVHGVVHLPASFGRVMLRHCLADWGS